MSGIKNIAVVGGSGNLGNPTLKHLLDARSFNITAISREESSATFPAGVKVLKGDYKSSEYLTTALKGQDALLLILGMAAMNQQFDFLEAAAVAGVKWIVPTEFASDTSEPKLSNEIPALQLKTDIRKRAEQLGLKWIALVTNQWLDFSLVAGLYDINVKNKKATIYDNSAKFNTTTLPTAALALARIIQLPLSALDRYANKHVYVSSGLVTQPEIFELAKEATGTKDADWTITHAKYEDRLKRGADEQAKGSLAGTIDLVYGNAMKPGMAGDYERTRGLDNEALGLPATENLLAAVKAAL